MTYDIFIDDEGLAIQLGTATSKKKAEEKIISLLSKYHVELLYAVRQDGKFFAIAPSGKLKEVLNWRWLYE